MRRKMRARKEGQERFYPSYVFCASSFGASLPFFTFLAICQSMDPAIRFKSRTKNGRRWKNYRDTYIIHCCYYYFVANVKWDFKCNFLTAAPEQQEMRIVVVVLVVMDTKFKNSLKRLLLVMTYVQCPPLKPDFRL